MNDLVLRIATGLPGFLLGIACHEAAHAYVASRFGDNTAKSLGRLTLNPLVHVDIFGTIIIPAISILTGGIIFGYAKPVPVDPRNFCRYSQGHFLGQFCRPLGQSSLGNGLNHSHGPVSVSNGKRKYLLVRPLLYDAPTGHSHQPRSVYL